MSEPRYLSGDEYALSGGYEECVNCNESALEYDLTESHSATCSEREEASR